MPQSMTTAPGLIQDPRTISGLPIATTRISAVAVWEHIIMFMIDLIIILLFNTLDCSTLHSVIDCISVNIAAQQVSTEDDK